MFLFLVGDLDQGFSAGFVLRLFRGSKVEIQGLGFDGHGQFDDFLHRVVSGHEQVGILFGGQPPFQHLRYLSGLEGVPGDRLAGEFGVLLQNAILVFHLNLRQLVKQLSRRVTVHLDCHGVVKVLQTRFERVSHSQGVFHRCDPIEKCQPLLFAHERRFAGPGVEAAGHVDDWVEALPGKQLRGHPAAGAGCTVNHHRLGAVDALHVVGELRQRRKNGTGNVAGLVL